MTIQELINSYNNAIIEGKTSQEFASSLGMKRKSLQQRVRRAGYTFDKEKNIYVVKDVAEELIERENKDKEFIIQKKEEKKKYIMKEKKPNQELDEVLKVVHELTVRVEQLEKNLKDNKQLEIQELHLRKFNTPIKQISYRYHKEVLDELDKVCRRYSYYTKHDIINTLLMDAIERLNRE
jgi:hypothetical protein